MAIPARRLKKQARLSLEKARDSALLAVEAYNKPAVAFKSGGFIVLMVIAWTSLFHAIFYQRRVRPWHRQREHPKRFERETDGQPRH